MVRWRSASVVHLDRMCQTVWLLRVPACSLLTLCQSSVASIAPISPSTKKTFVVCESFFFRLLFEEIIYCVCVCLSNCYVFSFIGYEIALFKVEVFITWMSSTTTVCDLHAVCIHVVLSEFSCNLPLFSQLFHGEIGLASFFLVFFPTVSRKKQSEKMLSRARCPLCHNCLYHLPLVSFLRKKCKFNVCVNCVCVIQVTHSCSRWLTHSRWQCVVMVSDSQKPTSPRLSSFRLLQLTYLTLMLSSQVCSSSCLPACLSVLLACVLCVPAVAFVCSGILSVAPVMPLSHIDGSRDIG